MIRRRFTRLALHHLEDRSVPAISGLVFQDFNANGNFDGAAGAAVDRGVAGVTVTAYDATNAAVGNALSDALGNYVLNASGSVPFRVEFTGLPAGIFYGPQGTASGSAVQFVADGSTGVNLSVVRPEDFSPDTFNLATSRYVVGGITPADLNTSQGVVQSFPSTAGTTHDDPVRANHQNPTTHDLNVTQGQVGATWGLAYDPAADRLLAAAFMKRTTGFGPGGPGAIYSMNTSGTNAAVFADLNAIYGDSPAGNMNAVFTDDNGNPVPFRTNIPDHTYWFFDGLVRFTDQDGTVRELGWDAVGKLALGGLDRGADARLYTVALGDRRLYSLPSGGTLDTTTVNRFNLPIPATVTGVTTANPLGDLRPFAVEEYRGIVYVGAVNSAESTQQAGDLRAYVFAFDPATGQFVNVNRQATTTEAVFEFSLNYPRGMIHFGEDPTPNGPSPPDPAAWNPWIPLHRIVQQDPESIGRSGYPQPMLVGLSFDSAGNLTLGLRDRSGDQIGRNVPIDPDDQNNFSYFSMTAGDTLQAFINAPGNLDAVQMSSATFSGWTLESNGRDFGSRFGAGPQNTGQGPGGGEFFYMDDFPRDPGPGVENDEVSTGGVLNLPGLPQTLSATFNPARIPGAINAGGVRWYDSVSGGALRSYELYVTVPATSGTTFAKGNGIGDLVAITAPPPVEIGNYVWLDANENGIQDAGEAGVADVEIELFAAGPNGKFGDSDDVLIGTAVTDANGNYIFSSGTGTSTTSRIYNLMLAADTDYQIRVDSTQTALDGFDFTTQFGDVTTNGTARDSNIDINGVATVHTAIVGVSDHSFDIGLVNEEIVVPPPPPPPLFVPSSVAGKVFRDNCPVDGILQPGETPFPGVRITLVGNTIEGPVNRVAFTDRFGAYSFANLPPGTYTISETQPIGFYDSGETLGSLSGTKPANDVLAVTLGEDQHGVNYNFAEIAPNSISGYVYSDVNNNLVRDSGDTGIPNVLITISGTAFAGTAMARPLVAADSLGGLTARTDSTGRWEFPSLPPGSYTVVETQPVNFLDSNESVAEAVPGPVTVGNDNFANIVLCSAEFRGLFNFGETAPLEPILPTKRDLLGTTGTTVPPTPQPPIIIPPQNVPLTPAFSVSTGTPGTPAFLVAAGGAGRTPLIRAFDYSTGIERFRFFAYEPSFLGGVRVATGDVNGDGIDDIVAATGQGGGPRVRVFSGEDGSILKDFFAYEANFRGGVFVAVGDVTGDGKADIITGTELGGGPRVTVFDAVTNARIRDFFAFNETQRGGVRVAVGDFNNDNKADLVTTAGRGTQTRVRIFDSTTLATLSDFIPYAPNFTGGVFIAAGDVTGDGIADVVTAADLGGGPHVQVFNGLSGVASYGYFADNPDFRGGIRLALADLDGNGDDEIVTALGFGGPAKIRIWQNGATVPFEEFYAFDTAYTGGIYIG